MIHLCFYPIWGSLSLLGSVDKCFSSNLEWFLPLFIEIFFLSLSFLYFWDSMYVCVWCVPVCVHVCGVCVWCACMCVLLSHRPLGHQGSPWDAFHFSAFSLPSGWIISIYAFKH